MDVRNEDLFDLPPENEGNKPGVTKNAHTMSVFTGNTPQQLLPIPQEDFHKKTGKIKSVRGRMLRRLLKYEFRYLFPVLFGLIGIVALLSVVFAVQLRMLIGREITETFPWMVFFTGMSLVLSFSGLALFAQIYPIYRYNKNFFKNEGYLTFSIPATAQEQILAKHIAALICSVCAGVASMICIFLIVLIAGGADETFMGAMQIAFQEIGYIFGDIFAVEPVHATLFSIELLLVILTGLTMMPCIYGAVSCFLSKYTGKKQMWLTILIVMVATSVLESVATSVFSSSSVLLFLTTEEMGMHLMAWASILLQTGLTVATYLYEVYYLKKKLDLK
ncbi:MAG: hypothetical protein E7366_00655 [Clostridiales bacterium]|nr:hypothetical protein [Clostridiales bacterium]